MCIRDSAHPSQALLDSFTIREVFPEVRGKRVLIVGAVSYTHLVEVLSFPGEDVPET